MKTEATSFVYVEKTKYVPEWELAPDVVVGEAGLAMDFFQHCFPPGSRQVVERVPTDVLIHMPINNVLM